MDPAAWPDFYHSFDELENAPELSFLIDRFMHAESIVGVCGAVGQRKSLVALNIAHALCTGEPLFGEFAVIEKPRRVLYLCPEMGMRSFRKRVRAIGLMPYVGKTFFCRTMNKEDKCGPDDFTPEELGGAVVILDTAVRFIEGNENDAQDMKVFAKAAFRLIQGGGKTGALGVVESGRFLDPVECVPAHRQPGLTAARLGRFLVAGSQLQGSVPRFAKSSSDHRVLFQINFRTGVPIYPSLT